MAGGGQGQTQAPNAVSGLFGSIGDAATMAGTVGMAL